MSSLMSLFISILLEEEETTEKCNAGERLLALRLFVSQQLGGIRRYSSTKLDRSSSSSRVYLII